MGIGVVRFLADQIILGIQLAVNLFRIETTFVVLHQMPDVLDSSIFGAFLGLLVGRIFAGLYRLGHGADYKRGNHGELY
jgi:hypothetical protein